MKLKIRYLNLSQKKRNLIELCVYSAIAVAIGGLAAYFTRELCWLCVVTWIKGIPDAIVYFYNHYTFELVGIIVTVAFCILIGISWLIRKRNQSR